MIKELLSNLQLNDYMQVVSSFLGAFFAFCFFVLGQLWISSMKQRNELLLNIERMREYISMQSYYFEINISNIKKLIENIQPIGISLDQLAYFPIEECVYQKLNKLEVANSVIKFVVSLRLLNENIRIVDRWIDEMSNFSRIAMLEKKEDAFMETMTKNVDKIKESSKKILESLEDYKLQIDPIIAEIAITKKYVESPFWIKWCSDLRDKIYPNHRKDQVDKLVKLLRAPKEAAKK